MSEFRDGCYESDPIVMDDLILLEPCGAGTIKVKECLQPNDVS